MGAASAQFRQLDKNEDGQISRDEAKGEADLRSHFQSIDTDHDGKLSAFEWNAAKRDRKL